MRSKPLCNYGSNTLNSVLTSHLRFLSIVGILTLAYLAKGIVLPIVAACIMFLLTKPLIKILQRIHIPCFLSSFIIVITVFCAISAATSYFVQSYFGVILLKYLHSPKEIPLKKPSLKKPLTRLGHTKLAEEHEWIRSLERPKTVAGIATAAAEGDRSENAEYIYGKKKLRELDRRLRYLDSVLKEAQVIDQTTLSGSKVCFGSTVTVETENGETKKWTIVGEGEADHNEGSISWKSPVALGLMGKNLGDIVIIRRPAGDIELEVVDLHFAGKHYLQS